MEARKSPSYEKKRLSPAISLSKSAPVVPERRDRFSCFESLSRDTEILTDHHVL